MVGIVRKVLLILKHNSPHKHHHHGGAVCPNYGLVSVVQPDPMHVTSLEGVGQGYYAGFNRNH